MRVLELPEIELVAGGVNWQEDESRQETVVVRGSRSNGNTYGLSESNITYGDVMNDCAAAVHGLIGTGLCGNTIQAGLEGFNEESSSEETQEDSSDEDQEEHNCAALAEAASAAQLAEDASRTAHSVDRSAYMLSEAADAALRACVEAQ